MNETPADRARKARQVTLLGALLDLALGLVKIFFGLMSNSYALLSDGIHSLSDLVTDAFVLLLTRIAHQEPDTEHPYGHRRFETLGTTIVSIGLFIVAGIICYDSVRRLSNLESLASPGWMALVITVLSIVSKEWIYRHTKKVATEIDSSLLLANAWHSRTDALSSIAVLVGIIGVWLGYAWMDLAAAVIVALLIANIAWKLIARSINELVDSALPEKTQHLIRAHIIEQEGIKGLHGLRSRLHGDKAFLDVHVEVHNMISVSEGHFIAETLEHSLKQSFPQLIDIVVHIDPELDPSNAIANLPRRNEVQNALQQSWGGLLPEEALTKITLHYLDKQVHADIYVDLSLLNIDLKPKLKDKSKDLSWLGKIRVFGIP